jgi:hypothetical protein
LRPDGQVEPRPAREKIHIDNSATYLLLALKKQARSMYLSGNLALFTVGLLAAAVFTSQVHAQEQGFLQDVALESIYPHHCQ